MTQLLGCGYRRPVVVDVNGRRVLCEFKKLLWLPFRQPYLSELEEKAVDELFRELNGDKGDWNGFVKK